MSGRRSHSNPKSLDFVQTTVKASSSPWGSCRVGVVHTPWKQAREAAQGLSVVEEASPEAALTQAPSQ